MVGDRQRREAQNDGAHWQQRLLQAVPPSGMAAVARFPRPLVVPSAAPPFDALELDYATSGFPIVPPREYLLRLAPRPDTDPSGWALVAGEVGRGFAIPERNPDPRGDPAYRVLTRPRPEARPSEMLSIEQFFGLRVAGTLAWVEHTVASQTDFEEWNVTWFDDHVDATYTIRLYGWVARKLGAQSLGFHNIAAAQQLVTLAAACLQIGL